MSTTAVERAAMIDGNYRYWLHRKWREPDDKGLVCWVMLNPSTADATQDDPTIRRCIAFSRAWGFYGLTVVNLFALRSTDWRALRIHPQMFDQSSHLGVVGPHNDEAITREADRSKRIIAAWGNHGELHGRSEEVRELLFPRTVCHLGLTKMLEPRHPLYVPANTQPVEWL